MVGPEWGTFLRHGATSGFPMWPHGTVSEISRLSLGRLGFLFTPAPKSGDDLGSRPTLAAWATLLATTAIVIGRS